MRYGQINCKCGQQFYFEARRDKINCINCNEEYDIRDYPEKPELEVEDEEVETTEADKEVETDNIELWADGEVIANGAGTE